MKDSDVSLLLGLLMVVIGFVLMIIATCFTRDWMVFALGAMTLWAGIKGI